MRGRLIRPTHYFCRYCGMDSPMVTRAQEKREGRQEYLMIFDEMAEVDWDLLENYDW